MSLDFVGSVVSLGCGNVLGTYQGVVSHIDPKSQNITVEKACRNGVPCTVPHITINAADIHSLSIIRTRQEEQRQPVTTNLHLITAAKTNSTSGAILPSTQPSVSPEPLQKAGKPSKKQTKTVSTGSGTHTSSHNSKNSAKHVGASIDFMTHNGNKRGSPNYFQNNNFTKSMQNGYADQNGSAYCNGNYNGGPNGNYSRSSYGQGSYSNNMCFDNGYGASKSSRHSQDNLVGCNFQQHSSPVKMDFTSGPNRVRSSSVSDTQTVTVTTNKGYMTPRKNDPRKKSPRDDCFSASVDTIVGEEFDFEKNLALFDKQAVYDEIKHLGYPQLARTDAKYKNDENVLPSKPTMYRQIVVGGSLETEFVTDTGLVVPSVGSDVRDSLLEKARVMGYSLERQIEAVGRSASEMVLQLIGGSHRLTPQNAHQRPSVVILCGAHLQGTYGVNCARHLVAHDVRVTLYMPNCDTLNNELTSEIRLYDMMEGKRISNIKDLPSMPVDVIVNALDGQNNSSLRGLSWYKSVVTWTNKKKAPVLGIDPPVDGGVIDMKWSLSVALPLNLSENCGQIYLCDLSLPKKAYPQVAIKYTSPFAHKFLIPLHRS